jgi:hypothetical protein
MTTWCGFDAARIVPAALIALEAEVRDSRCVVRALDSMWSGAEIQAALGRRGITVRLEAGMAVLEGGELLRVREQGLLTGFDELWLLSAGQPPTSVPDDAVFTSGSRQLTPDDAAAVGPILAAAGAWLVLGDGCGLNWATTSERARDVLVGLEGQTVAPTGWFAIRQLFHFAITDDGRNVFEERVVCFAGTEEEAYDKAEKEAEEYADLHGFVLHSRMDGYRQDDEPLVDGYEVWSMLYESPLSLDEFYAEHYGKVEHRARDGRHRSPRQPRDS